MVWSTPIANIIMLFRSAIKFRSLLSAGIAANLAVHSSRSLLVSSAVMASTGDKQFNDAELKKRLSSIEYAVTQEKATEPPHTGKYLHNKKPGTYTCVVCGTDLFSSTHKFESGCGWPAFSEALKSAAVALTPDNSHGMERTEVTCAKCGAHLGHVFDDGPPPKRTRYCINSASMSFTPAS